MEEEYESTPSRWWSKFRVNEETDCWEWQDRLYRGYGKIRVGRKKQKWAHRYGYELLIGPIPGGLTLDHLCFNPCCVNPSHLEPVTAAENLSRGAKRYRQVVTVCNQGHEFTPENTYERPGGGRQCRKCNKARSMKHWKQVRSNPELYNKFLEYQREYNKKRKSA